MEGLHLSQDGQWSREGCMTKKLNALSPYFGLILILMACHGLLLLNDSIYWDSFPIGLAPIVIGIFLLFSLLFIFIGLLGEYIGSIHSYVKIGL